MNYLRKYIQLIRKAQQQIESQITEKHHVFPKSIYGDNQFVVELSSRQHYIAHALLYRAMKQRYGDEHWKTQKMLNALWFMSNKRSINSVLYESQRNHWIIVLKMTSKGENNPHYGKTHDQEAREKMRIAWTKRAPASEETRSKMSEAQKQRFANKENHPQFNKPISEETRHKLSKAQKGKPKPNRQGRKWFNNGERCVLQHECPPGFVPGRLKRGPMPLA